MIITAKNETPAVKTRLYRKMISADFLRLAGKSAEGIICPTGPVTAAEQLPDSNPIRKVALAFRAAYEKANGEAPADAFSPYAFDGWLVFVDAAKRAKATGAAPGTPAFRNALREAQRKIVDGPEELPRWPLEHPRRPRLEVGGLRHRGQNGLEARHRCIEIGIAVACSAGQRLGGLVLDVLAVAGPMLLDLQCRVEHGRRVARMLLYLDADRLAERVGAVESRVVAGGAADVAIDRPARIEEQRLAQLDPLRGDRMLRIGKVGGQLLEEGTGLLQQKRVLDILPSSEDGNQIECLKHEAGPVAAQCGHLDGAQVAGIDTVDQNPPGGGPVDAAHDVHQGGLAASRGTPDGHELAGVDVEADAAERPDLDVSHLEHLGDVLHRDERRHCE